MKSNNNKTSRKNSAFCLGESLGFEANESYKLLRTNLYFSSPKEDGKGKIFGITSSVRDEGKSTTSLNLALALAESEDKIALVECDMRLPSLAKKLDIKNRLGLSNVIVGRAKLDDALQDSKINSNLMVLLAGNIPPNPNELLSSKSFKDVLNELRDRFDYVIVDLPPTLAVSDALIVAANIDGIIVVVRKDYCTRSALRETLDQLYVIKEKIIGFVMTYTSLEYMKYSKKGKYKYSGKYSYGDGNHYATTKGNIKKHYDTERHEVWTCQCGTYNVNVYCKNCGRRKP